MMKILFCLLLFSSCTTIHYTTKGDVPVYYKEKSAHRYQFEGSKKLEYYFFGRLPRTQTIYLDELARDLGFKEISKVVIEESISAQDYFWTFISLGLYSRRTIKVSGYGSR